MSIQHAKTASFLVVSLIAATSIAVAGGGGADVVGGAPVPDGDWRDAVAILGSGGRCSGTLVAPDVVLTAGHCIGIDPETVVIGAIDLARGDGEWIDVEWARAYPAWQDQFDVGVIVLAHASRVLPRPVARACTAREALHRGHALAVVGFGLTTTDGSERAVTKNAATIEVVDPTCTTDDSCQGAIDPGGEFIAGGGGRDACFGDSGGPAYADTAAGPVVLGVVSRGLAGDWACGRGGVYVRADRVASWIEDVTGRELTRARCDGSSDAPGAGDEDAGGGCAVGGRGGAGGATAVGILAIALAVMRRAATSRGRRGLA